MLFRLAFLFTLVGAQPIWERFADFRERFQKRYSSFEEFAFWLFSSSNPEFISISDIYLNSYF